MSFENDAFHSGDFKSISDVFCHGLNEKFWRHAITFSQGNDCNVTKASVESRLRYLRAKLLRKMFGNHWRGKGKIDFLVFKHGFENSFNTHYHALMGIRGDHKWSDWLIKYRLFRLDVERSDKNRYEKPIHIDYGWKKGNRMHSYVSRFVQSRSESGFDDFFIL